MKGIIKEYWNIFIRKFDKNVPIRFYHPNGKIESEFCENKYQKWWWPNGNLWSISKLINSEPVGIRQIWLRDGIRYSITQHNENLGGNGPDIQFKYDDF